MEKIQMTTPLVEMDGDEMTRILWADIKDMLIKPYVDLKTEYYDLGLPNRDATGDQVTIDSAKAAMRLGVAVKCATITPNAQRMEEYHLHQMWKSPNATIRAMMDGTVFRAPILVKGVSPTVRTWEKPITIARHAYGDVYRNSEMRIPGPGKAELVFTGADGQEIRQTIFDFKGPGILQGMHNLDASIAAFARSCVQYALDVKQDLWFSTKDTISKTYDHRFKDIFQEIYDAEYKARFEAAGITYFYTLIDDAVARVVRSKGGEVLYALCSADVGEAAFTAEQLLDAARTFLLSRGFGAMEMSYYSSYDGILTVNYAAVQNDVVLYPDLVKVQLSVRDGAVVGLEASGYWTNHVARTLELPAVSEEEAVSSIGARLSPLSARLCVIPTDSGEALCYEIRATDGSDDFLVYIDAATGSERELMQIVREDGGTLVQ